MMAHTGIFATSGATIFKAGANHPDISETSMNEIHRQAESKINVDARFNFSDVYATLNADVQGLLSEASANLTGIYQINNDMSGYTSRAEAGKMLDVLHTLYKDAIQLLVSKQKQFFMNKV